jgi:hypothetical protein
MSDLEKAKEFWESVDSDQIGSWADAEEATVRDRATEGLFIFKPSEFIIVEELEYDETIQRPEAIRFYTLEEQVGDAYDKMVPRGRTTKFKLEVLRKEVDRLRQLYLEHIVPTADTYEIREPEYGKRFSWIKPVYASADLSPYDYYRSWNPLFAGANLRLPNFFRRMIGALPRPFGQQEEGTPYQITEPTEFVDVEGGSPLRALPVFTHPRTQRHEDGRFTVLTNTIPMTMDSVNFVGYYAAKRPVPLPNPLEGHPFLKSSAAVMVETTAPLSGVVPSLDAILTHAVPVTTDPYGEGMKYLRVYDVELSDIPWSSWKSRFPPVEAAIPSESVKVEFPVSRGDKPSPKLLEYYEPYSPALSSRQWLMNQQDGGELVVQMLMSQSGLNGTVGISPGADGDFEFPATTISECELEGLDFQDFSIRGILRRKWSIVKDKDIITYQCVPLELIKQERKREGYKGRIQWTETTNDSILQSYIKAIIASRPLKPFQQKDPKSSSTPAREVSQLRHEVVVVLNDPHRLPEDKVRDVTELVKDATLEGSVYTDSKGLFLVCLHTISILLGDLAEDRRSYYDNWTARVDGFRVCKFCGEHVNSDVLENQDDYTDEGRVIKHSSALEVQTFSDKGSMDHIKSLSQLRNLFVLSNASDEVFFMLISLLYIVPEVDQLLPILTMGRKLAAQLEKNKLDGGVVGITQAALLIQAHVPPLVPRRSFSSKPLTLRGYPRDAATAEGYTIVDSLMMVLSKTLEAYPTSFKGSSATTMRSVLNAPKKVKDLVVKTVGILLKAPESGTLLTNAFARAKEVLPAEEPTKPSTMIPGDLVSPKKEDFGKIVNLPMCPTTRVYWANPRPPRVRQPLVSLYGQIDHFMREGSLRTKMLRRSVSVRVETEAVPIKDKAVLARLKMGKEGATEQWHTNTLIAARLSSVFERPVPLRTLDPDQKADELRDITKGYVYELLKEINKDPLTMTKLDAMKKTDLTIVMLTADLKKSIAVTDTLRAKERFTVTERLREMPDAEREITKDLMDRGLAPYLIRTQDRLLFAEEAAEQEEKEAEDVGVGRRTVDDDDLGILQTTEDQSERGDYGGYSGSNAASGNVAEDKEPNPYEDEDGQI